MRLVAWTARHRTFLRAMTLATLPTGLVLMLGAALHLLHSDIVSVIGAMLLASYAAGGRPIGMSSTVSRGRTWRNRSTD